MSGMTLRGKALWLVPVLALIGAAATGCTIKDQHGIERSASARPAPMNPTPPATPATGDEPVVVASAR